jgi:hypothetical protein
MTWRNHGYARIAELRHQHGVPRSNSRRMAATYSPITASCSRKPAPCGSRAGIGRAHAQLRVSRAGPAALGSRARRVDGPPAWRTHVARTRPEVSPPKRRGGCGRRDPLCSLDQLDQRAADPDSTPAGRSGDSRAGPCWTSAYTARAGSTRREEDRAAHRSGGDGPERGEGPAGPAEGPRGRGQGLRPGRSGLGSRHRRARSSPTVDSQSSRPRPRRSGQ